MIHDETRERQKNKHLCHILLDPLTYEYIRKRNSRQRRGAQNNVQPIAVTHTHPPLYNSEMYMHDNQIYKIHNTPRPQHLAQQSHFQMTAKFNTLNQDLRTSKNMYPLSNRRYFLMHFPFYNNERKIIIITTVYPQPQRKYLIQKVFITILTETSHYTSNTRRGRDLKKSLIRTKGKRPLQQSDRQHYISIINYNYKTYFHRPPSSEHQRKEDIFTGDTQNREHPVLSCKEKSQLGGGGEEERFAHRLKRKIVIKYLI